MTPLPNAWSHATLGDLALDVRNGISAKPDSETGLPILRISAVRPFKLDPLDTRFLPSTFPRGGLTLEPDDLLFTRYNGNRELVAACARVRQLARETVYPDKLIRVRIDPTKACPAYIEYVANSKTARNYIDGKLKTSAGQVGISGADLKQLPIPLPPLPEQKRIADKLDALLARVDACRERLDRVPTILKRFRQSVLAAATSGELTREWREERGDTREWPQVSMGSLLADVRYGTAKKCAYEAGKTPVLRIPNVVDGTINHDDLKFADFDERERAKLALAPGDLLVIRSNGSIGLVGRTALVSVREAGFLYAGYLIRLRPDPTRANSAYLSLFLASPASRTRIELTARSTAGVNNINAEEIRALLVPLPSLEEQNEIVRRIGDLFTIATRLEDAASTSQTFAERLRPSILAKAFRGELVSQDPNDEPAAALLARIAAERDHAPPAARGRGRVASGKCP